MWTTSNQRRVLLVVDDPRVIGETLRVFLDREPDLVVTDLVGTAAVSTALDGRAADVVLIAVSAPGKDGADLVRAVRAWKRRVPVLLLSTFDVPSRASRAVTAGANAYVSRHDDPETLLRALRRVLRGERFVSEQLHRTLLDRLDRVAAMLTPRERDVFSRLGEAMSPRQIADDLGVSIKTVETHQATLKAKLEARTARELVKCAIEWKARQ